MRRLAPPDTVQHIVTRFRNREFRIRGPGERLEYLRRVGESILRVDWLLLAFAVMSSHIHLAFLARARRIEAMMRSLNTGFGLWLNQTQGRSGPVFEGRFRSITVPQERLAYLLAYLHNNPVRASIVDAASASRWTSHRVYLGIDPAPSWLAVAAGLELAGFGAGPAGRAAFDAFVNSRADDGRDVELSGGDMGVRRAQKRREMGGPVELCTERAVARGKVDSPVYTLPGTPLRPRWNGRVTELLAEVADLTGVPPDRLCSRDRSRHIVRARRLALVTGVHHLGLVQAQIAAQLGLSEAAASQLLRSGAKLVDVEPNAVQIALRLRDAAGRVIHRKT